MGQANNQGKEDYNVAFWPTGRFLFHGARACSLYRRTYS